MNYKDIIKQAGIECPGPEPEGETPAQENRAFVSACMSEVSAYAVKYNSRLGNSLLTHSDIFGFVFRIDLQPADQVDNSYVNKRLLFWSGDESDAIGGTAYFPGSALKPL